MRKAFGTMDGKAADLYTLTNAHGMEASISTYGATLVSLRATDRRGQFADVTLGFDTLEGYRGKNPFFGCTVGRFANRIGGARFTLEGKEYKLAANDGPNCLHGGAAGFDKKMWSAQEVHERGASGVELRYTSPDGEEGFPGKLDVTVTYFLTDANELTIRYRATTDKTTILNLTNHAYWNLRGEGNGDILGHVLTIHADRFTPAGPGSIPTGDITKVGGTPLDFTQPKVMGERINADHPQLKGSGGYDHNFVIDRPSGTARLVPAAEVYDPESGRVLEVLTTEPGVQFYTGNYVDGVKGKGGKTYARRCAFCLETQHYPDSPNKPQFPSVVLQPGRVFASETVHRFSTR